MITDLNIRGLRGIREGTLEALPPLGVLIGPSGCGKSTVLEALLLATAAEPGDAVGRCIRRRMEVPFGSRFLCSEVASATRRTAELDANIAVAGRIHTRLSWHSPLPKALSDEGWHASIASKVEFSGSTHSCDTLFKQDNSYEARGHSRHVDAPLNVRFLDQRIGATRASLHRVLSDAHSRGAKALAEDLIRELVPDLKTIEILTPEDVPLVHLCFPDRAIPAALCGDGMESIVRLALELSSPRRGTVLIEEPEAHQHIAAMVRSARVIAGTVKAGSQVILSTHSLELLDLLIDALGEDHIGMLGVLRLGLRDGKLFCVHHRGEDVRVARSTVELDLR
ncbi:MAG: AAA family ATPase [Planctomycetes bacterium]|nr:AAA family ATPase [Planctomycetota bacterium]